VALKPCIYRHILSQGTSARIFSVPAEKGTGDFPDTVQKRYSLGQLAQWHCLETTFQLHFHTQTHALFLHVYDKAETDVIS
jgi:hypothetical protein